MKVKTATGSHLCVSIYDVRPWHLVHLLASVECWWCTESFTIIFVIGLPAATDWFLYVSISKAHTSSYAQAHARRAMDFLWEKRQRNSNLVGTTINIHSGEWVRRGKGWGEGLWMEREWKMRLVRWWKDVGMLSLSLVEHPFCRHEAGLRNRRQTFACHLMWFLLPWCVWSSCLSPDSGVGAGIDSYYEYLLKAYILLGDDLFLQRFNIVSMFTHT